MCGGVLGRRWAVIKLRENHWAVEVPEGAKNIEILPSSPQALSYEYSKKSGERSDQGMLSIEDLPPGTWEIVCKSKEATEEQATGIVEKHDQGWKDYDPIEKDEMGKIVEFDYGSFVFAIDSFHSLLTSKGCDTKLNWLILKKKGGDK